MVEMLRVTSKGVSGLVQALGELIRNSTEPMGNELLIRTLTVLSGRAISELELFAPEVQRLIAQVCGPGPRSTQAGLLQGALDVYSVLTHAGRRELIRLVANEFREPVLDGALLDVALTHPLPEGAAEDAYLVVQREWSRATANDGRRWATWRDFLDADYPERWDSVQVRLIRSLADDPTIVEELIEDTVRPATSGLPKRDRLTNAAKYVADRRPDLVIASILQGGVAAQRDAVGSASQIARHVEPSLTLADRLALIKLLKERVELDTRRVWPALVKLSAYDDALLDSQLEALTKAVKAPSLPGQPRWVLVVEVVIDALLQAASSAQLLRNEERLEELLAACGGIDPEKEAKLRGALTPVSARERRWIDTEVIDGPRLRSRGQAIRQIVDRAGEWDSDEWPEVGVPWFVDLLRVRHEAAVPALARRLRVEASGDFWARTYTDAVVARLVHALDSDEDPQVAEGLLTLLAELAHQNYHPGNRPTTADVERILAAYDRAVHRQGKKPLAHRPAIYAQTTNALTDVAKAILPENDFIAHVLTMLSDVDSGAIGGRSSRVLASLLGSVVRTYPQSWATLEAAWPQISNSNKRALAECAVSGGVANVATVAERLARRQDCPPEVATFLFRRLRR